jgi:hypothetical protein
MSIIVNPRAFAGNIDYDAMEAAAVKAHANTRPTPIGRKNNPAGTAAAPYVHGSGGLFSTPGLDAAIFNAMVQPMSGLASRLPVLPDPVASADYGGADTPMMPIFTGVTEGADDWANQPSTVCGDAPIGGLSKVCIQTAPYGLMSQGVREISLKRVGRLTNRGEMTDLRLMGQNLTQDPLRPAEMSLADLGWVNDEMKVRMFEAGVSFQRLVRPLVWAGNPTNNTNGARQFSGLELLINTGKKDLITGALCPAADSAITNWGNTDVAAALNGVYLLTHMERLHRYLKTLANQTGMSPVSWVLVMRPDLFQRLTEIVETQRYAAAIAMMKTINGTAPEGGQIHLDARTTLAEAEAMRNQSYLPLNGEMMEVVQDDTIPETVVSGGFTSDIYFVPMTALGGVPVTYWQFFSYDNAQARFLMGKTGGHAYTTDGGKFLWSVNFRNACFNMQYSSEPRILLHTPYLAARIDNVKYDPGIHSRDWNPDDALFYNGGRTNAGPNPAFYPDWSNTGVPIGVFS